MIGMRSALLRCLRVIRSKRLPSSLRTASMPRRRPIRSLAAENTARTICQSKMAVMEFRAMPMDFLTSSTSPRTFVTLSKGT